MVEFLLERAGQRFLDRYDIGSFYKNLNLNSPMAVRLEGRCVDSGDQYNAGPPVEERKGHILPEKRGN